MSDDPIHLISGYFDETLDAQQHETLNNWIKSDPYHADIFAAAALLHDRLHNEFSLTSLHEDSNELSVTTPTRKIRAFPFGTHNIWSSAAGIAIALLGISALWLTMAQSSVSAASRELDRIIAQSTRSKDRTYEIVVEKISTPTKRQDRITREERQRPVKPPLDGATLFVQGNNKFVLVRKTKDGLPFVTGSNGQQSWAINTRGPVRISNDIHRFDNDLPGHEASIPLTNLHDGLERLKQSYQIQLALLGPEEYEVPADEKAGLIIAIKNPKERGPQRVEIAYEINSGRILHMRFVQMPYGPSRLDLRLDLVDESDIPNDFFEHTNHHTPDHPVVLEND